MRSLSDADVRDIHSLVGRALAADELVGADAVEELSAATRRVTRVVAGHSSQLALKYLRELVPGTGVGELVVFLEGLVSAGAYSFRAALDLAAMQSRLGRASWLSDSDTHGDYLSKWITRADGTASRIRIFLFEDGRYLLDVLAPRIELHHTIRCDILPALEAYDIEDAEAL
jgi:hypothetical protein